MHTVNIYDSRNYQVLIDYVFEEERDIIYDSRNYQVLIDMTNPHGHTFTIYDSRNYQVLIDMAVASSTTA